MTRPRQPPAKTMAELDVEIADLSARLERQLGAINTTRAELSLRIAQRQKRLRDLEKEVAGRVKRADVMLGLW